MIQDNKFLYKITDILLNAKWNIGIICLTIILWCMIALMPHYTQNFDLISFFAYYSISCGLVGIVITLCAQGAVYKNNIGSISIATLLISIFTIITAKNVSLSNIGYIILLPVNIYIVMLFLKYLWNEVATASHDKR